MKTPKTHPAEFQKAYKYITDICVKQQKFLPFALIYGDGSIFKPLTKQEVKVLYETMQEVVNENSNILTKKIAI
jgi:hypothetical protein